MMRRLWPLFCLALLAGCASGPGYDTKGVDPALTPARAVAEPEANQGRPVIWGGVILATANLKEGTQIEVLGYPLDRRQRPDVASPAGVRFLAYSPKYLEPVDFAPGRQVTVRGHLEGTRNGRIGETRYVYAQLRADDLWLWPPPGSLSDDPQFHIGFGLFLHN